MMRTAKTLLIDDSILVQEIMEQTLNEYGITDIATADNGLLGLESFTAALKDGAPFNLVFLDIEMPVMDGQEALKRIRAAEEAAGVAKADRAVIIMATTLSSPADMMEAVIDGDCSDYYVKTVELEEIRALLVKYGFLAD